MTEYRAIIERVHNGQTVDIPDNAKHVEWVDDGRGLSLRWLQPVTENDRETGEHI